VNLGDSSPFVCKNASIPCREADAAVEGCGASKQMGCTVQRGIATESVVQNQRMSYDGINM